VRRPRSAVRGGRHAAKERWAERVEEDWGAWGTLYQAEGDRLVGFVQYGPSDQFPRGAELPAGPPSADAVLVTCAYLVDLSSPWVLQSLFLAAIGERDRGQGDRDFGYRYPEGDELRAGAARTVPGGLPGGLRFYPVRWDDVPGAPELGASSRSRTA
jgi:hypothetical protein